MSVSETIQAISSLEADDGTEQLKMGLQGITMASLTRAGWSVPEVEVFLAGLRREMKDPSWQIQDQA